MEYRDFINTNMNDVITALNGSITPAPVNSELYRDFLNRKADDVITALNGSITPAPAGGELYRDFIERKFDDVIAGIGGYLPPITFPTLTGSIVTFNSQYAGLPLKSHTVALTATQSGSGTPSPDNVRAISGFDSVVITRCGVNLWDEEWKNGYYSPIVGNYVSDAHYICSKNLIKVSPSTQYYIHSDNNILIEVLEYRKNGKFIGLLSNQIANQIITTSNDCAYIHIGTHKKDVITTYTSGISINYPSSETDYHAYNGNTYTIQIGSIVNEATYNARTGVLEVTQPSVQTLQLPPCPIDTLEGVNNIFADTGDTTLQYIKIGGN